MWDIRPPRRTAKITERLKHGNQNKSESFPHQPWNTKIIHFICNMQEKSTGTIKSACAQKRINSTWILSLYERFTWSEQYLILIYNKVQVYNAHSDWLR